MMHSVSVTTVAKHCNAQSWGLLRVSRVQSNGLDCYSIFSGGDAAMRLAFPSGAFYPFDCTKEHLSFDGYDLSR